MTKGSCGNNELEFPPLPFSPGQANQTKRRRVSDAFVNQRTSQCPAVCVPLSIDRITHDVMRMNQQYQNSRVITEPSTTMWVNGKLNFSNAEVPRPIPSVRIQQGIQGAWLPMTKASYGDNEPEFPIIVNVSKRAVISNMMSTIHTSEQPITHRRESGSSGAHRRLSVSGCLQTTKQEQHVTIYKAQELDISDSDVIGMWLASKVHQYH
jgi:hypothetical protein